MLEEAARQRDDVALMEGLNDDEFMVSDQNVDNQQLQPNIEMKDQFKTILMTLI